MLAARYPASRLEVNIRISLKLRQALIEVSEAEPVLIARIVTAHVQRLCEH